jgi:hypothetical protein
MVTSIKRRTISSAGLELEKIFGQYRSKSRWYGIQTIAMSHLLREIVIKEYGALSHDDLSLEVGHCRILYSNLMVTPFFLPKIIVSMANKGHE